MQLVDRSGIILLFINFINYNVCINAVDDEPAHGPDMYFILHGFHETEVISQLAAIGLQVHAVIKTDAFKQLAQGNAWTHTYSMLHFI